MSSKEISKPSLLYTVLLFTESITGIKFPFTKSLKFFTLKYSAICSSSSSLCHNPCLFLIRKNHFCHVIWFYFSSTEYLDNHTNIMNYNILNKFRTFKKRFNLFFCWLLFSTSIILDKVFRYREFANKFLFSLNFFFFLSSLFLRVSIISSATSAHSFSLNPLVVIAGVPILYLKEPNGFLYTQ